CIAPADTTLRTSFPTRRSSDLPVVDEEFNDFAVEQLDGSDLMVFGRLTYEGMVAWWPTEAARTGDPAVASRMNSANKIVASRTRSEEHTSELQSHLNLVCRLLL